MTKLLLDTDVLSALMRRTPEVVSSAREYLNQHGRFTISVITKYEIQRGLKAKNAKKQMEAFERFCVRNEILPIDEETAERGSTIYAELASRGELIGDADILIAATAMIHDLGLVTNNHKHFGRIKDLHVESWIGM